MKKAEYIQKLKELILNRVRFQAPNINKGGIDYSLLNAVGIDSIYPVFMYKKPLNKVFFEAFLQAKKEGEFNLILTERPLVSNRKIKQHNKTFLILKDEIGSHLNDVLQALNVNYLSHTKFLKNQNKNEFIKINNQEIILDFVPFYTAKKVMFDGIIYNIKEFLLNGKNYIFDIINTRNNSAKGQIEINIPLPQGYYFFKKNFDHIEIENLTSKQKAYFNFFAKKVMVDFSSMNGIESCTYACINMKIEIDLLPKQKKTFFFNFGEEKFSLVSTKEINDFFNISQVLMNKRFDVKITTKNQKFDYNFNLEQPKKIWQAWNDFSYDEASENEWLKTKNLILKNNQKGLEISEAFKGLKEVKLYRNNVWKRVFIVHNDARYLFAGRIKYYNFTILTKEIFDKNNEIYLSFAE
ncbi:MAG: hypothetical protein J6K97_04195 [Clostridia bacterium]|nr:hypothetical protein [Clostridia bacterium]